MIHKYAHSLSVDNLRETSSKNTCSFSLSVCSSIQFWSSVLVELLIQDSEEIIYYHLFEMQMAKLIEYIVFINLP
jgi:hypothetical protein